MPKVKGGAFSRKNLTTENIPKRKSLKTEKRKNPDILLELEKDDDKSAKDQIKCHLGELQF